MQTNDFLALPTSWQVKTLGEVCEITMGQSPLGEKVIDKRKNAYSKAIEFHQGKIHFTDKFIAESEVVTTDIRKIAPKNSVLLCVRAPVGVINITQRQIAIGRGLCALNLKDSSNDFLYFYLLTLKNYFNQRATGSTFSAINLDTIKNTKIPLPPLDIQKRIVSKLDEAFARIDNGVKHLKSAQNNIAKYKQSLLKAAFNGTLTDNLAQDSTLTDTLPHPKPLPQGEGLTLDSPAIARGNSKNSPSLAEGARGWVNPCNDILSCHTERSEVSQKSVNRDIFASANASQPVGSLTLNMTNDENPNLPQGWIIKTLGEVFKVVGGGTPATSKKEFWRGNIAWITSADIDLQGFTITPKRFITNEAIQSSTTNLVEKDTIVVVTRVGLGKVGITDRQTCFSQDSQALIPLEDLDVKFMAFQIKNQAKNFLSISRGTTISGITKNTLKKVKLVVPPLQTQKQIVEILEKHLTSADKTSEFIESALNKAKQLKSSLLKSAFEGKLV